MIRTVILCFLILASISVSSQNVSEKSEQERLIKYVKLAPDSVSWDPQKLVKYLKKASLNQKEMIELIYFWMADNIEYDVQSFIAKNISGRSDGNDIMKSRKAVCSGYSALFELLCSKANVPSVSISGYAKGYGYTGIKPDKPNHTWNAVKLYGKWKLIDVTWGSGAVALIKDSLIYVKMLNLGYLFSKPEGFIIRHFPTDSTWQLLAKPITMKEFYSKEMDGKFNNTWKYLK